MTTVEISTSLSTHQVPEEKLTSLGLYVTALEAYEMWKADPEGISVLDVRTFEEYVLIGHAEMAGGMVDGHILPLETEISFKFYEVVKWVTMANFGAAPNLVCMNKEAWNKIAPADQKIFMELSELAEKKMDEATVAAIDHAKAVLTEKGIELIELTPAELARWREACQDVESNWVANMEKKGLPAKEMVNEIHSLLGN